METTAAARLRSARPCTRTGSTKRSDRTAYSTAARRLAYRSPAFSTAAAHAPRAPQEAEEEEEEEEGRGAEAAGASRVTDRASSSPGHRSVHAGAGALARRPPGRPVDARGSTPARSKRAGEATAPAIAPGAAKAAAAGRGVGGAYMNVSGGGRATTCAAAGDEDGIERGSQVTGPSPIVAKRAENSAPASNGLANKSQTG